MDATIVFPLIKETSVFLYSVLTILCNSYLWMEDIGIMMDIRVGMMQSEEENIFKLENLL